MLALCALGCGGCGEDPATHGSGSVRVRLEAEATITERFTQTEDYPVSFTKYLVAVGHLELGRARGGARFEDDRVFLADLKRVGTQGVELTVFDDVPAGQWDLFSYETPAATAEAEALVGVDPGDAARMIEEGWTYWIEGVVERPEAEGGPVQFVLQAEVDTRYAHCELDGEPGVPVTADRTATAAITLHGDHLWFTAFPQGTEARVPRRSGWLVRADLDGDGVTTTEELAQADSTMLFPSSQGYDLGGFGDGFPIVTGLDFARAQLATQGHYRGEGHCTWNFAGVEGGEHHGHDHGH